MIDREIIDTMISLGRKLGIETIAEGIETEEQRGDLAALRCRYGQGFLFSRPLDAVQAQQCLEESLPHAPETPVAVGRR